MADVVVVGGGIIGCLSAYYLALKRLSVAVIEKGYIACEQSSRSNGRRYTVRSVASCASAGG